MKYKSDKYPDLIARFYDVLYDNIRSGQDLDFYLDRAEQAKGKVLEIGCGTGRLMIDAHNLGVDIKGIDNSAAMVDALLRKDVTLHGKVEVADGRHFEHDTRYDLIMAPFRVFSHLIELEDQLLALQNIHRHLTESGRLIFDLYIPDLSMLQKGIDRQVDFDGYWTKGKRLIRRVSMTADLMAQISLVTMEFEWEESSGWNHEAWTFPMRYYFKQELDHLMQRSPFRDYHIYGDFSLGEIDAKSKEFIIVADK